MVYKEFNPHWDLSDYIDAFWTVGGSGEGLQKEKILPDGCVDLILNLGGDCKTDNGNVTMQSGKTYLVGVMTTSKESFINSQHRFIGIRFKPAAFSCFFNYTSLHEITNETIELEKSLSPDIKLNTCAISYLNHYLLDRINPCRYELYRVLNDISQAKGQITIDELLKKNSITARQLERKFKKHLGISPKAFVNIIRFQFALKKIKCNPEGNSLLDIAFETGYYDHAHLTNEIKRYTGLAPSQL